jgi:hypothetical protein
LSLGLLRLEGREVERLFFCQDGRPSKILAQRVNGG